MTFDGVEGSFTEWKFRNLASRPRFQRGISCAARGGSVVRMFLGAARSTVSFSS
jgi:hypothetical protein